MLKEQEIWTIGLELFNKTTNNMAEPKPLILNAPRQGIAQSPNLGFGALKNIDIFSSGGVARLNNILAKKTGTTVDALVKWIVRDPDTPANIFALDSNGVLYKSANSGATWTEVSVRGGTGQGLIVKWGYVFVCETTTIDVMKISDSSWTDNWQTIDSDSLWHPMISSVNDNKIYGGAGRYVFSIEEDTTFDPTNGATYTFTQQALDLPANYRIKCLEELGSRLMIGTWRGTTITDFKIADIFPWDRVSPSFNKPVQIAENGVNAMKTIGNSIIVLAGVNGTIYKTDGVNVYPIGQIPEYIADLDGGKFLEPMPGAIINFKGIPYFGLTNSVGGVDGTGVWSLMQTSSGNILNFEHQISTNETGLNDIVKIGSLLSLSRDEILVGWQDDKNTAYGIDKTTNTSYTTGYEAYFESPLYQVGTFLNKRQFRQLEILFTKELASNEGIKVYYRINLTDSWTLLGTYDYSSLGAVISHNDEAVIPHSELLQIKVELTGTTTTPHFKNITLR